MKRKIAILTIFQGNYNYGGMLQAYALSYIINRLGYNACQIIFDGGENPIYPSKIQQLRQYSILEIFSKFLEKWVEKKTYLIADNLRIRKSLFDKFEKENIFVSNKYDIESINHLGQDFEIFIVGSDQVWNPNVVNRFYLLDFPVYANAKRLSYAASIGRGFINKYEGECFKKYLDSFDAISVREDSAKALLEKAEVKVSIKIVLDPTMLLSTEEWNQVCSERMIKEKYVLLYSFSNCLFQNELKDFYTSLGYQIIFIPYVKQKYNKFDGISPLRPMWNVGPAEFLSLIRYADVVVTDSFHGAVFSIMYNRTFYVFNRDNVKAKTSKNVRLCDLLNLYGLSDRMIENVENLKKLNDNINYVSINQKRIMFADESIKWLQQSLE